MRYIHYAPQIIKHEESGQAIVTNHCHVRRTMDLCELIIITKGQLHMHQKENFITGAGEVAFILPNEEHFGFAPSHFTMHWTHFYLPKDRIVDEDPIGPFGYITLPVRFKLSRVDQPILLCNALEAYRRSSDTADARNAYLTALITELATQIRPTDGAAIYGKRLNAIINYIKSNVGHVDLSHNVNLDIKSISEIFGYSEKYIYELFRKNLHVSPHKFITDYKLNFAAERLLNTGDTVAAISSDLGYVSPQHFMKQFKAHFGVTPSQYRNDHVITSELFFDDGELQPQ